MNFFAMSIFPEAKELRDLQEPKLMIFTFMPEHPQ